MLNVSFILLDNFILTPNNLGSAILAPLTSKLIQLDLWKSFPLKKTTFFHFNMCL